MSDLPPDSRPLPPPDPAPTPTQAVPTEQHPGEPPAATPRQRLRDRVWSLRAVIAVALASVILGGLGGAALATVSDRGGDVRFGPGNGRFSRGGPGGPPGQLNGGPGGRQQFPDRRGTDPRQGRPQG